MEINRFLFKQRISYRWRLVKDFTEIVIDFWVGLYILIPALLFILSWYRDLFQSLPSWFLLEFQPLLIVLIGTAAIWGMPRTYLSKADLVFLFHKQDVFKRLYENGLMFSILLLCLKTVIVLIFVYPFFLHIEQLTTANWIIIGGWTLLINIVFSLINWLMLLRLSSLARWLFRAVEMTIFLYLWSGVVVPYIRAGETFYLILSGIIWPLVLILSARFLPIRDWELVAEWEQYQNAWILRLIPGNRDGSGRIPGKKAQAGLLSRGRLGFNFRSENALTYFFVKYLLRKRGLKTELTMFYIMAFSFAILSVPLWFKLLFLTAIVVACTFWMEISWNENSTNIFLRMLPLDFQDISKGISSSIQITLSPLVVTALAGSAFSSASWNETVLIALVILLLILILPVYSGSKLAHLHFQSSVA